MTLTQDLRLVESVLVGQRQQLSLEDRLGDRRVFQPNHRLQQLPMEFAKFLIRFLQSHNRHRVESKARGYSNEPARQVLGFAGLVSTLSCLQNSDHHQGYKERGLQNSFRASDYELLPRSCARNFYPVDQGWLQSHRLLLCNHDQVGHLVQVSARQNLLPTLANLEVLWPLNLCKGECDMKAEKFGSRRANYLYRERSQTAQ